jgi:hypothetical protein
MHFVISRKVFRGTLDVGRPDDPVINRDAGMRPERLQKREHASV